MVGEGLGPATEILGLEAVGTFVGGLGAFSSLLLCMSGGMREFSMK